mmetsp:Transcript_84997/g.253379  ORF Transcript_84997/g.253379 Transcript_84997/m.253379 type:complete len:310 (-) Transcript_84997:479-1408(-)
MLPNGASRPARQPAPRIYLAPVCRPPKHKRKLKRKTGGWGTVGRGGGRRAAAAGCSKKPARSCTRPPPPPPPGRARPGARRVPALWDRTAARARADQRRAEHARSPAGRAAARSLLGAWPEVRPELRFEVLPGADAHVDVAVAGDDAVQPPRERLELPAQLAQRGVAHELDGLAAGPPCGARRLLPVPREPLEGLPLRGRVSDGDGAPEGPAAAADLADELGHHAPLALRVGLQHVQAFHGGGAGPGGVQHGDAEFPEEPGHVEAREVLLRGAVHPGPDRGGHDRDVPHFAGADEDAAHEVRVVRQRAG